MELEIVKRKSPYAGVEKNIEPIISFDINNRIKANGLASDKLDLSNENKVMFAFNRKEKKAFIFKENEEDSFVFQSKKGEKGFRFTSKDLCRYFSEIYDKEKGKFKVSDKNEKDYFELILLS